MIPKLKAFTVHLLACAVVAGLLIATFVRFWFPQPYFSADGGWQGVRLVAAVDLVLGPILTLVVYSTRKTRKELFFDYTVIGALQVLALASGIWAAASHRTALVIFADGTFYSVDADTVERLGDRARAIVSRSGSRPAYGIIRMPRDDAERQKLRRESLTTRRPLILRGDLLEPLGPTTASLIQEAALDLDKTITGRSAREKRLREFLTRQGREAAYFRFFPAVCRYRSVVLAIDPAGCVAGALDVDLSPQDRISRIKSASTRVQGPGRLLGRS